MRIIALLRARRGAWKEGHHDVRMMPLRSNICSRIRLANLKLAQYFCPCIPAPGGVTPNLPPPPEEFRRIKVNTHTVGVAHLLPVKTQQALNNQERLGNDILGRAKVSALVIVMRLKNRFSGTEQPQMRCHHLHLVARWIQRGDAQFPTLLPVIAMVVIRAEYRGPLSTQNLNDASTECRFASRTVAHDPQDDRACGRAKWYSHVCSPNSLHCVPVHAFTEGDSRSCRYEHNNLITTRHRFCAIPQPLPSGDSVCTRAARGSSRWP